MINIDRAEAIVQLVFQGCRTGEGPQARRLAIQMLHDVEELVGIRQKKIRRFFLTVDAVQRQYERKNYASHQLLERLDAVLIGLDQQTANLCKRKKDLQMQIADFEQSLQDLRDYAQARRTKKTKREQQYNHFYFIPVLSTQYKQKYIRARDKNAMAEQRLSDIRSEQERCRELLRETAKELTKQQQDREQAQQQWQTLEQEITKASKLVQFLKEGQTFWSQFDGHQSNLVLESGRYLIRALQEHKVAEDADFRHWIATFKMACMEYGEGEQYGDRKWDTGQMEVEYDCSRCHQFQLGWPCVDKVRSSNLLCSSCYQSTRTSMIMEKKMAILGERLLNIENRRSTSTPSLAKPALRKVISSLFNKSTACVDPTASLVKSQQIPNTLIT